MAKTDNVKVFFRPGATQVVLGLGNDNFGDQLRSARQASRLDNVFVNYFEVWTVQKGGREFLLDKAYMHLDVPYADGSGDEEVLALHCDPTTPQYDSAYRFKRGLHLHISSRKRDISKAHLALCHGAWEETCSNYESFSNAISSIVKMIDLELLPKLSVAAA
jgi:hypothetical protein